MRVSFNPSLKIAGIGLVPWTRLGPEKWFKDYKIASLYGWDIDVKKSPPVVSLIDTDSKVVLPRLNTQSLLENPTFQSLLKDSFDGYNMLTYKPVTVPHAFLDSNISFMATDRLIAGQFEDKAYFRRRMSESGVRFPQYRIVDRKDIPLHGALDFILDGREEVVLQDAKLSGGKGTFLVNDEATMQYALNSLDAESGSGTLVLSERISNARERTVQGVVTGQGVFIGPLQKQIVRDPILSNLDVAEGDKFCGAEIGFSDSLEHVYPEIKRIAEKIGEQLLLDGYRGIFGVDYIVGADDTVYLLEVNARITGVTPLLTALYRDGDIPFYLLHILELAAEKYSIEELEPDRRSGKGALLVIHAHNNMTAKMMDSLASGIYDTKLNYINQSVDHSDLGEGQILLQRYISPGSTIKPGGRLYYLYTNKPVLDSDDSLKIKFARMVQEVQKRTVLEEI